ncbi:hypothetical protein [Azospirillum sp. SYSU D00513]|uniref:hypothetical protein n=1 Tax=Azospirillum sp. SYSU D00513 TaxID=2812561 RepID=UPI001A956C02|nr:hypothetical protein [Azospirillum sp. SYSU D00513]
MFGSNFGLSVILVCSFAIGASVSEAYADQTQKQLQENMKNANDVSKRLEKEREQQRLNEYNKNVDRESGVSQSKGVGVGSINKSPAIIYTQPMDKRN